MLETGNILQQETHMIHFEVMVHALMVGITRSKVIIGSPKKVPTNLGNP